MMCGFALALVAVPVALCVGTRIYRRRKEAKASVKTEVNTTSAVSASEKAFDESVMDIV